ncbi:hypothetical protein B0H14DRAFT_3101442 [Mycena olivaceomarginata]|nr:hypothetical protein B0H14DRAFT_3101442 [Mycena olivaceomarginata]
MNLCSHILPWWQVTHDDEWMSILNEAIHSLNSKMASLMSQRRDLESRLEQSVWRQSPSSSPKELLSSILSSGVDETKVSIGSIMLVCRYWLEVSLSTPLLWAKIAVSPHHSLEKARRKLAARNRYTSSVMEQVVHAMDLFRPAVPNRPQAHAVLLRCQEDAPLLEVLSIRIYHAMQDDNYSLAPLPLFNGRTPRLRSCSLTSFNFGWDVRLLRSFNAPSFPGILRECPQLEELALRDLSDVDCAPCFSDSEDFDFPQLTKIASSSTKKAKRYSGLTVVYTQALTCLPLRRLRIETSLFDEMKLVDVLGRLPSLVTLELVDCEDASSGLLRLIDYSRALSSSQPWVCPKLESLTLDACTSLDWGSLRTFVESRLPANSHARHARSRSHLPARNLHPPVYLGPLRLRAIDVTRCSQISQEMVQWLQLHVASVKCQPMP